jgi:hypothetical protein
VKNGFVGRPSARPPAGMRRTGGRPVAITGANLSPDNPSWRDAFATLQERGRVVFTAAIDGRVYARHPELLGMVVRARPSRTLRPPTSPVCLLAASVTNQSKAFGSELTKPGAHPHLMTRRVFSCSRPFVATRAFCPQW